MAIGSIGCSGDYALEMSQLAQASQPLPAQPTELTPEVAQAPVEQIDSSAQPEIATTVDLYV